MKTLAVRINETQPKKVIQGIRQEVITEVGIHRTTWYRYLWGDCNDQRVGIAIAKRLNITLDQLLDPTFTLPTLQPIAQ